MNWEVPLFDREYDPDEEAAVTAVLRSGWLTQGEIVAQFERTFAERMGSRFACAVSSATAGLHLAAHALGLGPGDEVIVPSLTFVATVNTMVQTGATPVFADVESEARPLLDAADVERKLTDRTRAVVAMHYGGHPCNMTELEEVLHGPGLALLEDCAHAPLAEWAGRKAGTFGAAGVFSFFSNKNISTGEGGMIVTDDEALARRLTLLRSHGMTTQTLERHKGHAFDYDVLEPGFNYRFDELRAAMGLVQLRKLEENTRRRAECAARYGELLRDVEWIRIPFRAGERTGRGKPALEPEETELAGSTRSAYHIFPVVLAADGPAREHVMATLRDRGIQTSIHYRPVHDLSFYRRRFPTLDATLPVTTAIAPRLVTLPLYPALTVDQQEKVVAALRKCET